MPAIFIETSIFIHDFFYRYPEFYPTDKLGSGGNQHEIEAFREEIHLDLLRLSLENSLRVGTTSAILQRFAAILDEYKVPVNIAREEIAYLLHNYMIDTFQYADLCEAVESDAFGHLPPALAILKLGMMKQNYSHMFTCQLWPAEALLPIVKLSPGMIAPFISGNITSPTNADS
jgi:hypothetical protein